MKTIKTKVSEVRCIQASRCKRTGKEIFTLECSYPRAIHSQLLTHSVFSKNSSSTRAVPLKTAVKQLLDNPAKVIWTTNQAGMQGPVVTDPSTLNIYEGWYNDLMRTVVSAVEDADVLGIHKQNAGRPLEAFQNIKIVLTSTEWENWDWLRVHEDAQGEIADLATAMKEARDTADIMEIGEGEWHVPYVERIRDLSTGELKYFTADKDEKFKLLTIAELFERTINDEYIQGFNKLTAEEAKAVSSSVCAQTSYRKADYSLEKAMKMKSMLIDGHKVHASPFEHSATPMPFISQNLQPMRWPKGVTHMRRDGTFGSGNFVGFIQLRQLIENHDKALF